MKLLKLYKTPSSKTVINVPYIGKGKRTLAIYLSSNCELDISAFGLESLKNYIADGYKKRLPIGWKP